MKINKYLVFAFIYFFINSLGLPFGLTYTALLSPLFYWWIITSRQKDILLPFFVCLIPFIIVHLLAGVDTKSYIISLLNYTAVYIFSQAFYTFLKTCKNREIIFKKVLITNFILCLAAVVIFFTPYAGLMWMEHTITNGVENVKRLKLFTYEASHYATIFIPLFFFYLVQLILRQNKTNSWLLLTMIALPIIISFSIGVIASALAAIILTAIIHFRALISKRRVLNLAIIIAGLSVILVVVFILFVPANSFFLRLENIITGNDTSGKGRTLEAFMLGKQILEQKSVAWGVGPGQIKILGPDIIRSYYLYDLDYTTFAIPNAVAETMTIFGIIGISLRILVELFFFFFTKAWTNYYRLLLFIFMFVYQFTGSFITNTAEYVIWILAFTNAFPAFNVRLSANKNYAV